ncbi:MULTISPECIES: methyltransferase domain-containing protein [unclassified Wenzhouxiangella]|uniref:methyltransferase domain-containing protein n=1 Tax=unclassified Wenzhouxiangella TaxID=2613841 RepID=UPI000E32CA5B|nr:MULTISPECIES: methyltransferase domain-containing protein [unclassified Wenzhouxiangella]RFF26762.1 SAM-dependent methyltransferase [Wenzhouxiangella sp. 15181]RFP67726.1 SAM-dependent methyltransferase [Wenzhouxiangella sp. 15190]
MHAEESAFVDGSFRDPAGFMFERDGILYRQVNEFGRECYEQLMASGLYDNLVEQGWLIPHQESGVAPARSEGSFRVIEPERIPFVSYPYEWSFSQYRDAALVTLDVQLAAIEHGMILKDASAYNVQFHQGRPLLIDTLSFAPYEEGQVWEGYRQFCQHFLAPLLLMARRDIRLSQLMKVHIDGVPLDLASRLLERRSWFRPGILMHLHLHARAQARYAASDDSSRKSSGKPRRLSKTGLVGIVSGLRSLIAGLDWKPAGTEWADYYQATNYSDDAFAAKRRHIERFLDGIEPKRVWDLGGNTGVFSRVASQRGIETVSFDIDPAAVEINYREVRRAGEQTLLPLVMDLTNPSPALGWAGRERDAMHGRGPVDCAMALALIHHLAISNNVPLERIAAYFARLCDNLIIEFVPKADSQVKRLLSSRQDIFDDYHEEGFERAFSEHFELVESTPVEGSERTLYWLRRRA